MSRDVSTQLADYFSYVDETQGAVDVLELVDSVRPIPDPTPSPPRRSRWWVAVVAAAAVLLLIGVIPFLLSDGGDDEPIDQPDIAEPQGASPPNIWVTYEINSVDADGEFVAGGRVMIVGPNGEPRDLVEAGDGVLRSCPRFSPDGTMLAFGEGASPGDGSTLEAVLVIADFDPATGTVGNQRRIDLSGPPVSAGNLPCPSWSPDGERLAYITNPRGGLTVIDSVGGQEQRLAPVGDIAAFEWSPAGDRIAVVRPPSGVWLYPVDGSEPTNIVPLSGDGPPFAETVSWAPDDRRLVVGLSTYDEDRSPREGAAIWMIDLDGTVLAEWPGADIPGSFGPIWSPDGQWIAYASHDAALQRNEIVLISPETGEEVHLDPGDTDFFWAGMRWFDAEWIVVLADREASTRHSIVMVSVDPGVEPHTISDSLGGFPSFIPSTASVDAD